MMDRQAVRDAAEAVGLPLLALAGAFALFGLFVAAGGHDPWEACRLLFAGAFGDAFSWQNTLTRAAPLMLTALCVALPAQGGLVVIGGEGALVLGGLACAALPMFVPLPRNGLGTLALLVAAAAAGAAWVALAGVFRQWRGVNETIGSLLLSYIAIALFKQVVEGPLRDPASLNKPSTPPLPDALQIGSIGPWDVHWGLAWGVALCLLAALWLHGSTHGFATRVVGGNIRAARLVGLPATRLVVTACALGGAAAGLAGGIEVAAVHTSAPSSITATDQVAAVGGSSGSKDVARSRSARVTEGPGNSWPDAARAKTRRTLVSSTATRAPNAKAATAAEV